MRRHTIQLTDGQVRALWAAAVRANEDGPSSAGLGTVQRWKALQAALDTLEPAIRKVQR